MMYPDPILHPVVWLHYGPVGPPKEMAPAGKQRATSDNNYGMISSYQTSKSAATAEAASWIM